MSFARRRLRLSGIDLAITIAVVGWALVEAVALRGSWTTPERAGYALAVTAPMLLRNRLPATILTAAFVAFIADLVLEPLHPQAVTPLQLLPLATYALASVGGPRRMAGTLAIGSTVAPAALWLALRGDAPPTTGDVVALVVLQVIVAFAGWAVRLRREEAARQSVLLEAAHHSADAQVRDALGDARAQIARELRAIVARSLTTMEDRMASAGTATADELRRIAADVQGSAAGVMVELQRLLGLLHDGAPGVALPVSPEAAVAAAEQRGWQVELSDEATATPGAILAAGRVIEELLGGEATGAQRGPSASPAVRVRTVTRAGGLRLRVSGPGLGRPLADPVRRGALAERVRLHGGTMRVRGAFGRAPVVIVDLPAGGGSASRAPGASGIFAEVMLVGVVLLGLIGDAGRVDHPWLTAGLGVLVFAAPVVLRRRAQLAGVFVIAAGMLAFELLGLFPDRARTPLILGMLGAAMSAMHVPSRRSALAGTVAVCAAAVAVNLSELPPGAPITDTPVILFLVGMSHGFGRRVREQMEATSAARDDEARVAAGQSRRLRRAVDEEGRAVARDLHDIVAHGVSLIGVLAGAAHAQLPRDPERARASIRSASATIAQVRVELERLTVALGAATGVDATDVGLADVAQLVAEARAAGQEVEVICRDGAGATVLDPGDWAVQPGIAVSAYRIVQEALTNARKHAPGAATTVRLTRAPDRLAIEVRSAAPAGGLRGSHEGAGTGRGIAGMRERARLLGGALEAGAAPDGAFVVRAVLPTGGERARAD